MKQEQKSDVLEEKTSEGNRGLGIIVGGSLGYLIGRALLKKPVLGTALGVGLGFVLSSSKGED